jgi:ribonucleoside-diphosphate reductase alpha chain
MTDPSHWDNPVVKTTLEKRYLKKDDNGVVIETLEEMFRRVANAVAQAEVKWGGDVEEVAEQFFQMMWNLDFLPNSPTLMNAGTEIGQLSACFVLPVEDSIDSIWDAAKKMAIIFKSGGGVGMSFSRLRPKGDLVSTSKGKASGPVSFMHVFDTGAEVVKQGGRRRGALMGCLRVDHPDIMEFIRAKDDLSKLTNFNMSVLATDEFMKQVKHEPGPVLDGGAYYTVNPHTGEPVDCKAARGVFNDIIHQAWKTGEPGLIFIDRMNAANPTPELGDIESTNPCGEQPLLPNESCNLGSINLANMVKGGALDCDKLVKTVHLAIHFLDDVIEVNKYPLSEIREATLATRKIGLGVMGWAEFLIQSYIKYDSPKATKRATEIMALIQDAAKQASCDLAKERAGIDSDDDLLWNATRTTIAPTGSISIIAGVTGGIEPIFAVKMKRQNILDKDEFEVSHPLWDDYPHELFRESHQVAPEWHVRMQAAFQAHTDNAVSKTVNLSHSATEKDVASIFLLAYDSGCKGITVYRDGCREDQPMTTFQTQVPTEKTEVDENGDIQLAKHRKPRSRGDVLPGNTYKIKTGCGNMFITVTRDEDGEPLELFAKHGKAGVCSQVQCEAIGRLVSLGLRSNLDPNEIQKQLGGITCHFPHGIGPSKVLSCADAVAQVIGLELKGKARDGDEIADEVLHGNEKPVVSGSCPDCGAALIREAGCAVCRVCGYSNCG